MGRRASSSLLSGLALLALAGPASAAATPKAGRWTGRGTNVHGKLTFKVAKGGHRLKAFNFHGKYGSLHCGGSVNGQPTIGSATIYLPHAKISGGRISGKRVHNGGGIHEKDVVRGKIGRGSAHGTVKATYTGGENCGTPRIKWIARFGHKAPPAPSVAKSIAGGQYRGKTGQGYGLSITVAKSGKSLSDLTLDRIDLDCVDGSSENYTDGGFSYARVKSDGSFTYSKTYSDGSEFNVTGTVGPRSAHGVLGMSDPNASCESGNVPFRIARR